MLLYDLELCPTCKKGKFRATGEVSVSVDVKSEPSFTELSSVRELICDYCGQKRSIAGLNEYV